MTERKRLIELIASKVCTRYNKDICLSKWNGSCGDCECGRNFQIGDVADHLLENGVIVPLAYIGQTAYYLFRGYFNNEIIEGKISMLQQKADKSWKIRLSYRGRLSDFTVEDFDKNVFFTYEAAEKALKEANDERKAD